MPLPGLRAVDRPHSVRTHLIAYGLAVALPLVGLLGLMLMRAAQHERAEVETRMLRVAGALADDIDRDIDRRLAMLQTLATSPALAARDWPAFYTQAKAAAQDKAYIILVDTDGRQIVNTYVPYGAAPPLTGDPATVRRMAETKQPVVSDLFKSLVAKRPVFNISMPVLQEGAVRYVMSLGLLPKDLLPILESQKLDAHWIATIWDRNDVLLARSRDHDKFAGKPLSDDLRREIRRNDGVVATNNLDGARVLLAIAHPKLTDWRITVNVPLAVAEAPLKASAWLWGGASALMMAMAGLLAFLLARRLEQPLLFAADAARALGRGERVSSFVSNVGEANVVVDAMGNASRELAARERQQRLLLSELSHRVKNVLAVVQAVVSRTLADGRPDARELVNQRLHALARAHDMLIRTDWQGAPLKEIVTEGLSAHSDRVFIDGPDVMVSAKAVQMMALVLHELCTNATKYGSLSSDMGSVNVTWAIEGEGETARFRFTWEEHGGPAVSEPTKKGFGSTLLESAMRDHLSTPRLIYAPDGFRYELDVLLATILKDNDAAQSL